MTIIIYIPFKNDITTTIMTPNTNWMNIFSLLTYKYLSVINYKRYDRTTLSYILCNPASTLTLVLDSCRRVDWAFSLEEGPG
jgi:hypothetical protein